MSRFAFKWTSLNKGLINFRDLKSGWFLWGVPILAIVLEAINNFFRTSIHVPTILFTVFVVALPMACAQVIYATRCPDHIKNLTSESDWREKADQERNQILHTLQRSTEIKEFLAARLQKHLSLRNKDITLNKEQLEIIQEEFTNSLEQTYTSDDHDLRALSQTKIDQFHKLNESRFVSRFVCSFSLNLAIIAGFVEIFLRMIDVFSNTQFTFYPG